MTPVDERMEALEQRLERIETLLGEMKETVTELAEARNHRHRHVGTPNPYDAIARAKAEEYQTFAWGMKLAGGLAVSALVCWLSFQVYQDFRDGRWNQTPMRLLPP